MPVCSFFKVNAISRKIGGNAKYFGCCINIFKFLCIFLKFQTKIFSIFKGFWAKF